MTRLLNWLRAHGFALAIGGTVGISVGFGAWHGHYDVTIHETQVVGTVDAGAG